MRIADYLNSCQGASSEGSGCQMRIDALKTAVRTLEHLCDKGEHLRRRTASSSRRAIIDQVISHGFLRHHTWNTPRRRLVYMASSLDASAWHR